jgi:hypothetical protein
MALNVLERHHLLLDYHYILRTDHLIDTYILMQPDVWVESPAAQR